LRELPGGTAAKALHAPADAAGLERERGHPNAGQSARHDPRERLEVVIDVDSEPVCSHSAREVYADRGDLPVLHPHTGVVGTVLRASVSLDAFFRECGHQNALEQPHVRDHIANSDDRVPHELSGSVIRDLPAAVGFHKIDPLAAVPALAHRQLARAGPSSQRVDGRVLERQEHVRQLVALPSGTDALL